MDQKFFKLSLIVVGAVVFTSGCSLLGVKQLSRNNVHEDTLAKIVPCQTTKQELAKILRMPSSSDDVYPQDSYTVYVFKGFDGRFGFEKRKIEVLINDQDVVVDRRLDYAGTDSMLDQCQQAVSAENPVLQEPVIAAQPAVEEQPVVLEQPVIEDQPLIEELSAPEVQQAEVAVTEQPTVDVNQEPKQ